MAFLILVAGWTDLVTAADWPQFLGPHRNGFWQETNLLKAIPADGLKVRWRNSIGPGWSSPVVAQGKVFLTDVKLDRPMAKERVLCFAETNGESVWTVVHEVPYPEWAYTPEGSIGPTPTPIIEEGRIYSVGADGYVACLEVRDGKIVWDRALGKQYELRELSCRPSPLLADDLLILFVGAKPGACVIALNKITGEQVWKALDDAISNSSPMIVEAGGKRQLIVWTEQALISLDPATGTTYWREAMFTSNNDAVATPVAEIPHLLISGLMMRLNSERPEATVLWPEKKELSRRILSHTATPVLHGDHVYAGRSTGELVCLEAATGKVIWETNTITEIKNGASVHITFTGGESVFLFTEKGDVICARLNAEGYREFDRFHLLDPVYAFGGRNCVWALPSYANGHIFVRNEKELVCASLVGSE